MYISWAFFALFSFSLYQVPKYWKPPEHFKNSIKHCWLYSSTGAQQLALFIAWSVYHLYPSLVFDKTPCSGTARFYLISHSKKLNKAEIAVLIVPNSAEWSTMISRKDRTRRFSRTFLELSVSPQIRTGFLLPLRILLHACSTLYIVSPWSLLSMGNSILSCKVGMEENSSKETRSRAKNLAKDIGS